MLSSHAQLVAFFSAVEGELQSDGVEWIDYFPVIRTQVYFAQRAEENDTGGAAGGRTPVALVGYALRAAGVLTRGLLQRLRARQLFVAPAKHRNVLRDGQRYSKHLDSLVRRFGGDGDITWEVGPRPGGREDDTVNANPGTYLWPVAALLARLRPVPRRLQSIGEVMQRVQRADFPDVSFDAVSVMRALSAFDICRGYYRRQFRGSGLERAYIVVYYSLRNLPLISALNDLGIETIEYQHGIQNDRHPLYTHWEHLVRAPAGFVNRVLVWDEVAQRRIKRWGDSLGVAAEVTGNLWYEGGPPGAPPADARAVLVALQIYPQYFNPNILTVVGERGDLQWIFREHPVYPLEAEARAQLLADYPNIEIVGAVDESLDDSMARCACCITGYSTVGIEALLYKRVAIFTDNLARDGLDAYFDGERCFYAETADEIRAAVAATCQP